MEVLCDRSEFHQFEEGDQLSFHLRYPQMVAKASKEGRRNSGVPRVDLPRVHVKDDRIPFSGPASEKGFGQGEWVDSKVPSPSERDPEGAEGPDRHRYLPDFSVPI